MDLRGHGRSVPSAVDPDYSIEGAIDDISALADTLEFDKFHLLTHATGGMAGSRYAMAAQLKRLKPTAMNDLLRSGTSFNQIVTDVQADPRNHWLGVFFKACTDNKDLERFWCLVEQLYATNNPRLCADFAEGFFLDPDPQVKGLQQIGCSSMVLVGEYDCATKPFGEQMARNIPNAEYVHLDKVGHMTAIEDHERTCPYQPPHTWC